VRAYRPINPRGDAIELRLVGDGALSRARETNTYQP
jgi:hypothetical protein